MKKNYGRLLKKFREEKNLSQNQLGKLSGLTSSCINQLEANLRSYSLKSILLLSDALEITPNELLDYKKKLENQMSAPCLCPHCEKWFDVDKDGGFDDIYDTSIIICKDCYKYQQKDYKESIEQSEIVAQKTWNKIQKIKGKMIIKVLGKAN